MKDSLRQQLQRLVMRLTELDANLADPQVTANLPRYRQLAREQGRRGRGGGPVPSGSTQREADLASAREMLDDPEMAELARDEVAAAEADVEQLHATLQTALLPRDPDDGRNAFVEIRAGAGGEESALFAADLARMYLRFRRAPGLAHRGDERKHLRPGRLQGVGDPRGRAIRSTGN